MLGLAGAGFDIEQMMYELKTQYKIAIACNAYKSVMAPASAFGREGTPSFVSMVRVPSSRPSMETEDSRRSH